MIQSLKNYQGNKVSIIKMKEALFALAKKYKGFVDINTKMYPKNEEQFSVIFKQLCQDRKIDLQKINLYSFDNEKIFLANKTMTSIVSNNYIIENEFMLKGNTPEEISEWGNMRIDISINTQDSIVFIENKIGSTFTYKGKEYSTQMRRYINYLKNIENKNKTLMLLSSKLFFDKKWYLDSYLQSITEANGDVNCYCICWEEVFEAII